MIRTLINSDLFFSLNSFKVMVSMAGAETIPNEEGSEKLFSEGT